ncbi:MAG: pseudouridine synthase [Atribacterota bacterium]|nr:pseudouridine synthase [Atribacterota bacterium]
MMKVRLQKYLANNGIDSRRKSEDLIVQGQIKVNNIVVTKLGTKIDPAIDIIKVNDKVIKKKQKNIYIILNKPRGYLCTRHDPFGRPTIYDLLKDIKTKVNYAGRLDYLSEGLVFLTNDGDLIHHLTHPKKSVQKIYVVKIKGYPSQNDLLQLEKGIPLTENFTTSPCKSIILRKNKDNSILQITIHEGKKRQIRRMLSYIGFNVVRLKRIKIGFLTIENLETGKYRYLTPNEIKKIKKIEILKVKN